MDIHVVGLPQSQGSKNPWGGEANKKLGPWRGHVTQIASDAWNGAPALLGPVRVDVTFSFPRPKSHFHTGARAANLRADAPFFKTSAPDLDKLQRAIGDALKEASVYRDDSQIAWWNVVKIYDDTIYADIQIIDLQALEHHSPSGGRSNDTGRTACACSGTCARAADPRCGNRPHQGV